MGRKSRKLETLRWVLEQETDECIEFPWNPNGNGYGHIKYEGKNWKAHRLVCFLTYGNPPTPKHEACHRCHNRKCWNKNHLRWGTHSENMRDMHRRRGTNI